MLSIPFGETRTYGDLAKQIGDPKAVRAVGAANGKNPIAIIGPCHRVIGASGKLTGYAGGLKAKALLLRLEGRQVSETDVVKATARTPAGARSQRDGQRVVGRPQCCQRIHQKTTTEGRTIVDCTLDMSPNMTDRR